MPPDDSGVARSDARGLLNLAFCRAGQKALPGRHVKGYLGRRQRASTAKVGSEARRSPCARHGKIGATAARSNRMPDMTKAAQSAPGCANPSPQERLNGGPSLHPERDSQRSDLIREVRARCGPRAGPSLPKGSGARIR